MDSGPDCRSSAYNTLVAHLKAVKKNAPSVLLSSVTVVSVKAK